MSVRKLELSGQERKEDIERVSKTIVNEMESAIGKENDFVKQPGAPPSNISFSIINNISVPKTYQP